jgi:hypothetical protein
LSKNGKTIRKSNMHFFHKLKYQNWLGLLRPTAGSLEIQDVGLLRPTARSLETHVDGGRAERERERERREKKNKKKERKGERKLMESYGEMRVTDQRERERVKKERSRYFMGV